MNSDSDAEAARIELVQIAKSYLSGARNVVDTSRRIDRLRHWMPDPMDELFLPFINLVDDAELFPPEDSRHLWNPDYLSRLDLDRASLELASRETMRRACESLLARFGIAE